MMLLIVGGCHFYFAIIKEVCGVGLCLLALIQNPVIAQVGEVTLLFSFPCKLMFLPILMLRSDCGPSLSVHPLICVLRPPTVKDGGLFGDFPLPSSALNDGCADCALYMASAFCNTTHMNMPGAGL
jgi:hypothetical protein